MSNAGFHIEIAKTAGFCFGVRNALNLTQAELDRWNASRSEEHPRVESARLVSFGPLIHNRDVIASLSSQGLVVVESAEEIQSGDEVIIRAHGVGKNSMEAIRNRGAGIMDATCPFVKKIHKIVSENSHRGKRVIILGDREHPEVQGIIGWCEKIPEVVDADDLEYWKNWKNDGRDAVIVEQTTFNREKFKNIVEICSQLRYNIKVYDTICNATTQHQEEAISLAKRADLMLILGGKNSSNTKKLFEISRVYCPMTYHVENAQELRRHLESSPDIRRKIRNGSIRTIAITAGASTPDHIIQEVALVMSENEFEALFNESFKEVHSGDIVKGTVVSVTDNDITLNIGYKSDAMMIKEEFSADSSINLKETVHVDDELEVQVVKVGDSEILVSRKRMLQKRASNELESALENHTALSGKVVETMENGVVAVYEGNRVFIPGSLLDIRRVDPKTLAGQEISFRILRIKRGRIMGDRRSILFDERNAKREETLSKITEGARLTGTVKNLTSYCAFIDLGGIDGMLHVSEMSWSPVHNPANVLAVGDEIDVMVKSFDPETNKISLTAKLPENNPWNGAEERYEVGAVVEGKVVRFAAFGAFVELEKGIDGLVHISHISNKFVKAPADVLEIGQIVTAKVIDFDPEKKRISLSLREFEAEEEPVEELDGAAEEEAPEQAE